MLQSLVCVCVCGDAAPGRAGAELTFEDLADVAVSRGATRVVPPAVQTQVPSVQVRADLLQGTCVCVCVCVSEREECVRAL